MEAQKPGEQPAAKEKAGNKFINELRGTLEWIGSPQGMKQSLVVAIVAPFTFAGMGTVFDRIADDVGSLTEKTTVFSSDCSATSRPGLFTKRMYDQADYYFKEQTVIYTFNALAKRQEVSFRDLTHSGRAKAQEVAEKLPLECRYQKKFDL